MKGSPLKVNTFNENVLSGLGQKAASPGWLREVSWQPRFNQGSIGAWNNNVGGNIANVNTGPEFNLSAPGGNFFISPSTVSGSTVVQGTLPIQVASNGATPPTFTVSMSTTGGDYGSGSGSVGGAISDAVNLSLGSVGMDMLRLVSYTAQHTVNDRDVSGGQGTLYLIQYACEQLAFETSGSLKKYDVISTGSFYHVFSRSGTITTGSADWLVDNRPTLNNTTAALEGDLPGVPAGESIRRYEDNTVVIGRKFDGGSAFAGNTWFGASLPSFNTTCS